MKNSSYHNKIYIVLIYPKFENEVFKISPILIKTAIVVGSLVFIFLVYFLVRTTPDKYYSKAARMHKCGESRYCKGNHEGSKAAYQKAEEYRKRARELE
ncbi:MAG: hypothetical protein V1914_03450 [archaeon]